MSMPKKSHPILFESLPSGISNLGSTLFPDSLPSAVILPLTYINTPTKQWLHEKELIQLSGFSFKKRHREWLGGRICAKQGLHTFLQQQNSCQRIPEHQRYRVASEESGKPYFTGLNEIGFLFPELSISHSKDFAAALISKTCCGIDIQYPADNLYKVKEKFSTAKEEALLQRGLPELTALQQLTLLWAGKEAVQKMLSPSGIPGFHELILQKILPHGTSTAMLTFARTGENNFSVAAGILNTGYGLAFCCENKKTDPPQLPGKYHA
ncbi:MAG: 4'-phosphopantetheinyl transferase superfamily protein [Desulfocapsa sp.]|nr:4'-phosphopantetheinyl transferase superfamily protein [Desulfocapsa sp.]